MLKVALYQPEIPPNTGNIIRLCANSGAELHLIHPLGFELNDKQCRRAGLDYQQLACVNQHQNINALFAMPGNIYACSTKGQAHYSDIQFQTDDILLFGPETRGLPNDVLSHPRVASVIRIPMLPQSRSLNLSNAVAIILYEAWRQCGFTPLEFARNALI